MVAARGGHRNGRLSFSLGLLKLFQYGTEALEPGGAFIAFDFMASSRPASSSRMVRATRQTLA